MPSIVLIGAPGAGKSTVGRELAEMMGATFLDTDQLIEEATGESIADIFINQGEAEFRRLERQCVAGLLQESDGSSSSQVISVGGGAVLNPDTQSDLRAVSVAWLVVDLADALKRVGMNQSRPLLLGNVRANMITLMHERAPIYESLANITLNTSEMSVTECASELRQFIESRQT